MIVAPQACPSVPWSAPAWWSRLDRATLGLPAPLATLDLTALEHNVADMLRRAGGTTLRVASKSVRVRGVLEAVLAVEGFAGVFAYTLAEAIWLVRTGTSDDVVVGYPTVDRAALGDLVHDPALARAITLVVDDPAQLDVLDAVAPPGTRETVRVCLDLDTSLRVGPVRLGVLRSPVRTVEDALSAARHLIDRPGVRLVGLLAYEAQVAGYPDEAASDVRVRRWRSRAVQVMHRASVREVAERRAAVVAAVSDLTPLEFVNGGGTGSLETTSREAAVTEIAAGSGLFGPGLFDLYSAFDVAPAAAFALDVVRRPAPGTVTVLGGGWVASGPAAPNRLPRPVWPTGLEMVGTEGAGEVQTPLTGAPDDLLPGDRVWFRHAKAGELSEHVASLHVVRGDMVVDELPTYRGEGKDFL